jgi:hypothetical protein
MSFPQPEPQQQEGGKNVGYSTQKKSKEIQVLQLTTFQFGDLS